MECPLCGRWCIDLDTGFDVDEVCPFHTPEEVEEYTESLTQVEMGPDGWREPDEETEISET